MTLATQSQMNSRIPETVPAVRERNTTAFASSKEMTLDEVFWLAEQFAASRMIQGVETPQQAFMLMMICQSEGLHPMEAVKRYHFIEGHASMRADAMQAEFQARGGVVKILRNDWEEARAHLSHPTLQPNGFEFSYTYEQAVKAGLNVGKNGEKVNWKVSRPDMLWSRMITKGIRKIYPGIVAGIYSDDEVQDMITAESPAAQIADDRARHIEVIQAATVPVPGQPTDGIDDREYVVMARGTAKFTGVPEKDIHNHVMLTAINKGIADGPIPSNGTEAVKRLRALYVMHPNWVRQTIADFCGEQNKPPEDVTESAETSPPLDTTEAGSGG